MTVVRAASVVLVLAAIVAQAIELANHGAFDPTRFFAYFTIQSNLIGVVAFALLVLGRGAARSRGLELLRGAAAVYLTVTFFVVIFLLSGIDVGLQLGWVDFVLHKLFPVIVVLDWIVDPPTVRLSPRDAITWLVYPLIWTGADAGSRGGRRLVSVPVPGSGQRWLWPGSRDGGGRDHRVLRDLARDDLGRECTERPDGRLTWRGQREARTGEPIRASA